MTKWGSPVEIERWKRIKLSIAAYAYEFENQPIMSDRRFDKIAEGIVRGMDTGNAILDRFFDQVFTPMTGMWIHKHPELGGIQQIYERHFTRRV